MPASRRARATTLAPRSCPSRPGLATTIRSGTATSPQHGGRLERSRGAALRERASARTEDVGPPVPYRLTKSVAGLTVIPPVPHVSYVTAVQVGAYGHDRRTGDGEATGSRTRRRRDQARRWRRPPDRDRRRLLSRRRGPDAGQRVRGDPDRAARAAGRRPAAPDPRRRPRRPRRGPLVLRSPGNLPVRPPARARRTGRPLRPGGP